MPYDQDTHDSSQDDQINNGGQVALLERTPPQENDVPADALWSQEMPEESQDLLKGRELQELFAPPARSFGRLLALTVVLIGVTLGMGLSLLYLASTRNTIHPEAMKAMLVPVSHLPFTRLLLIGGLATGVGFVLFFVGLSFSIVDQLIRPQKSDSFIPLTPFALDLPAEEIQFSPIQGSYQVNGIFIPKTGAMTTIIVCPGYRRTYRDVLGMCKHLWLAGHNVLAFEYYGHGSVIGASVTLGYREINDFLGAVAYAKKRAPATKLGALGYSMGGAVSIMGSARVPDIEAVVADSAFATHWSAIEVAIHRTLGFSRAWPRSVIRLLRLLTDQVLWLRAGYRFHQVEPVREIKKLAPRPILLIHGLSDTIVSPYDAQQLYQAAGKPKALWLLPNAEHTWGYFADTPAYVARITEFFEHRLKGNEAPKHVQAVPLEAESRHMLAQGTTTVTSTKGASSARPVQDPLDAPLAQPAPQTLLNAEQNRDRSRQAVVEQILIRIFAQTLSLPREQVKVSSDFFQLGGDADTLEVLLEVIEEHFQVHLAPGDVFDHSVLFRLAAVIHEHIARRQRVVPQDSAAIYA